MATGGGRRFQDSLIWSVVLDEAALDSLGIAHGGLCLSVSTACDSVYFYDALFRRRAGVRCYQSIAIDHIGGKLIVNRGHLFREDAMWMQENNTVRRFCVVAAVSIGLCSVGHATTINLRIGTLWDQYSDDGNEGAGLAVADGW